MVGALFARAHAFLLSCPSNFYLSIAASSASLLLLFFFLSRGSVIPIPSKGFSQYHQRLFLLKSCVMVRDNITEVTKNTNKSSLLFLFYFI